MHKYQYPILAFRVIDGDSIETVLDQGFHCSIKLSCRINGIDAPERRTDAGKAVKAVVLRLLESIDLKELTAISLGIDKYSGRYLGDICWQDQTLSQWLLNGGMARPYGGGRKPPWAEAELERIQRTLHQSEVTIRELEVRNAQHQEEINLLRSRQP